MYKKMLQVCLNILIANSDALELTSLSESLSDPRYRVQGVSSDTQAWDALQHGGVDYDLVLLADAQSGVEILPLLARIRADPRFDDVPVIVQTEADRKRTILDAYRGGAYACLLRPYDQDLLLAIVGSALGIAARQKLLGRQLLESISVFTQLQQARFEFSNLTEARQLSTQLAKLCPAPEVAVVGLAELMVNAVEHGNLEIGFEEKGRLNREGEGAWVAEIERRMVSPLYRQRRAHVEFERLADCLIFRVCDQGKGFDWASFLGVSAARAQEMHGRGIAMAKALVFPDLFYEDGGRVAVAAIKL